MQRHLDSTGHSTLEDSWSSGEECGGGPGDSEAVMLEVDILDLRMDEASHSSRTVLQVSPLGEETDQFTLRFATNHHSFSLGRSVANRSIKSFYFLQVHSNSSVCSQKDQ